MGRLFVCDRCIMEWDDEERLPVDVRWTYTPGTAAWTCPTRHIDLCPSHQLLQRSESSTDDDDQEEEYQEE